MRYRYFDIENFRGIRKLRFDLDASRAGNIITLVGLNESGKTTILEAINFFSFATESTDPAGADGRLDLEDKIPIAERDNFNGDMRIVAGVAMDQSDVDSIRTYMRRHGYRLESIAAEFEIEETHSFENSVHAETHTAWRIDVVGRRSRQQSDRVIEQESDEWRWLRDQIEARLPSIRYFPNFLFQVPNRILIGAVLTAQTTEPARSVRPTGTKIDTFYRQVLQDILDSLGRKSTVERHLLGNAAGGHRRGGRGTSGPPFPPTGGT